MKIKQSIFIITAMLLATQSEAQWATNAWPSTNFHRAGFAQRDDLLNALLERVFDDTGDPVARSTYRTIRRDVFAHVLAHSLKVAQWTDNFVATNYADAGNFDSFFATSGEGKLPTWSPGLPESGYRTTYTNLTTIVRMPTNYFTFSTNVPYRSLNEWGGFTNDPTAGLHGFTNEYTANGGIYFPSGRTNWYTTDYGRDTLRKIINRLLWRSYGSIPPITIIGQDVGNSYHWVGTSTNSWTEAKTTAEAASPIVVTNYAGGGAGDYLTTFTDGTYDGTTWNASARAQAGYIRNTVYDNSDGIPTVASNTYHQTDYYVNIYPSDGGTFDAQGSGFSTTGLLHYFSTSAEYKSLFQTSSLVGLTNFPVNWCDEPSEGSPKNTGWKLFDIEILVKYDVSTNGYKFIDNGID